MVIAYPFPKITWGRGPADTYIELEFVGIVGRLSTDPQIRALAAYGSALLADNDE